jgi:hypothetical protein
MLEKNLWVKRHQGTVALLTTGSGSEKPGNPETIQVDTMGEVAVIKFC